MEKILTHVLAVSNGTRARYAKEQAINPNKPFGDFSLALTSIEYFPEKFETGFQILLDTLNLDAELIYEFIAKNLKQSGMKNDPTFLNQKCINKIVCLSLWLAGVSDADMRERSKGKRQTVMDPHLNNLIFDTFKAFTQFTRFGDVKSVTGFSMHEFRCMQGFNYAADNAPIGANTDDVRMHYFNIGACDYKNGTVGTQSSQMKTMLITLNMVNPEMAIKGDYMHFNLAFSKLIARMMKINAIKRIEQKKNG